MITEDYYKYYENKGLSFDRALLTTYCLSMYTKPFVILSGISGTGKTKIAQFFNVPASVPCSKAQPRRQAQAPSGKWIIMTVTSGLIGGDGRANFKYSDLDALLDQPEIDALQPRIKELKRTGAEDNICEPFDFIIETPDGEELKAKAYLQRASSPLLRVRFKSKRGEPSYDSTTYFSKNHPVDTVLKLEKVASKRLRIASVNNREVIHKASEMEDEEVARVENACFLSVRSDWTDATPLFGYYNLIDRRYYLTPALAFILKAKEYPKIPFFLVLDEMNLAKVEHYFSDFLSCLESRYMEDGVLKQEPIHLHSDSGWLNTNNEYFDLIPPTLELPKNLFVTGTVNVDESTYMFSPKVLDRANVIELNEVDIQAYASNKETPISTGFLLKDFPDLTNLTLPSRGDFESLPEEAKSFLIDIHSILSKYNLHFGYRVINEISKYVTNAQELCVPQPGLIDESLDWQIIQKVLPKLNGPQSKLDTPIRELLAFLSTGKVGITLDHDEISKLDPELTKYPRSVEKLKRMFLDLTINGFANFIE